VGHAGLRGTCKQIQNHYNDIKNVSLNWLERSPYLHISHY